jgi:dephospho-CoA kinase
MLARRGAHLLQADVLAHQLYAPGAAVYGEVVHHFGREILNDDGTINRASLARVAFPNRIGELNAIVHPAVIKAQNEWMAEVARENPHGIAVVEAALIIEAGVARDFDKIIVVTCDFERRVERYAERASISLAAALSEVDRRGAAQLPDEEKVRHADYVIENSGAVEDTERQVEQIWNKLQTLASGCS